MAGEQISRPRSDLPTIYGGNLLANPGDRIAVPPGRFGHLDLYGLHGRPDAWITIECLDPAAPPIIDARGRANDGIDVQQCSFVALFGFQVLGAPDGPNPDASGVAVFRGSRNVRIWSCDVRDFPGGGINCFWAPATEWDGHTLPAGGWDGVDLAFNTISGCCRRSAYNTSGISFFGAEMMEDGALPDGVGFRALQNRVEDCRCEVPYSVGGLDFITDGNGISVDSLVRRNALTVDLGPYRRAGRITGNLVRHNGGRGLHVLDSGNIEHEGNTYVENLWTESPAFIGAAEVEVTASVDRADAVGVVHRNNLVVPRAGRPSFRGAGRRENDLSAT